MDRTDPARQPLQVTLDQQIGTAAVNSPLARGLLGVDPPACRSSSRYWRPPSAPLPRARVLMPLTEVAPETTVALFADPEGHVVGLMLAAGT